MYIIYYKKTKKNVKYFKIQRDNFHKNLKYEL